MNFVVIDVRQNMEVLKLNQLIFLYLGICSERYPTQMGYAKSVITNIFMVASYSVVIVCSATFIWTHMDDIPSAIFSTMQFVAYAAILGTYVSFAWKKQAILDFFHILEDFATESAYFSTNHKYLNRVFDIDFFFSFSNK